MALGHADLIIDSILATPEQAGLLQVEAGAPLLHIERLT
jgi:GntR family transcriptional regulator